MTQQLDRYTRSLDFFPLIELSDYKVLDLSNGPVCLDEGSYALGKYLEKRPGQYSSELFEGSRDTHLGIDICAPASTNIYAPWNLRFFDRAYLSGEANYGYCLVGKFIWDGPELFFLLGHLNKRSFDEVSLSRTYKRAEKIGEIGDRYENGNWFPHLHFQLSYERPSSCDMPGVCREDQVKELSKKFPDPRLILGDLY